METATNTVLQAAMKLPENERLILVARLLETMPVDDGGTSLDDDSLVAELDRRFAEREHSHSWSDLRAENRCRRLVSRSIGRYHSD